MLVYFTVENYLSYKDKVTLNMVSSSDRSLPANQINLDQEGKNSLLKIAAIYGANASGKTNLIRALGFLRDLVLTSHQKGDIIDTSPFKLDEQSEKSPSHFEVSFIAKDIKYVYGLSVDKNVIHKEYLYSYPRGRKSVIFERWDTDSYRFTKDKEEQETLSKRTLPNQLYLSTATQWNYAGTANVFDWFKHTLKGMASGSPFSTAQLLEQEDEKKEILAFLREADLGIMDVKSELKSYKDHVFPKDFPEELRTWMGKANHLEITFSHRGLDMNKQHKEVLFDSNDESNGTNRMFNLAGPLLRTLSHEGILLIDELESSLHPNLVEHLLRQFNERSNLSQLIFTTHNSRILSLDILRKDQVWITEKLELGSTDLYPLSDIQGIRKNHNIEKGYLAGKYGGVPYLD